MTVAVALALVVVAAGGLTTLFQVGRRRPSMPVALLAMAAGGAAGYPIGGSQGAAVSFTVATLAVTLGYVVGPAGSGRSERRLDRGGPSAAGS